LGDECLSGNRFSRSTLQPLGVPKSQSSRWQNVGSLPDDDFEGYVAEAIGAGENASRHVAGSY
jgi:hypothetical protein